ncbi:hypothetical protein QCA50_003283 [Cerrena zonata]|uniref:Uncharacterized protein n=1 Tax=Cerrena zonata TaxID=2478898 RepID=A0AAW0GJX4_9APHY
MVAPQQFTKVDLTPKRHHGYAVVLFIMGTLFPPLAVAARFGIGGDFWLNLLLTICGYIPGHGHNFYIQNIRNNKNHQRTPKWAQRYGLIDTSEIKRKERRSQWAGRYNDRLPRSTLEDAPYAEGQNGGGSSVDVSLEGQDPNQQRGGELWSPQEETYYGQRSQQQQNGDTASVRTGGSGAMALSCETSKIRLRNLHGRRARRRKRRRIGGRGRKMRIPVNQDSSSGSKRRKSKKKRSTIMPDDDTYSRKSGSTSEFPEDPEGGLYGDSRRGPRRQTRKLLIVVMIFSRMSCDGQYRYPLFISVPSFDFRPLGRKLLDLLP